MRELISSVPENQLQDTWETTQNPLDFLFFTPLTRRRFVIYSGIMALGLLGTKANLDAQHETDRMIDEQKKLEYARAGLTPLKREDIQTQPSQPCPTSPPTPYATENELRLKEIDRQFWESEKGRELANTKNTQLNSLLALAVVWGLGYYRLIATVGYSLLSGGVFKQINILKK